MSIQMETITRNVLLNGLTPMMFDRYPGGNDIELKAEEKFYFMEDGKTIALPALNIHSFLSATNTRSACRIVYETREYKEKAYAMLSYVLNISPELIPITRNGVPIRFEGFGKNGIELHRGKTMLKNGIPKPWDRPFVKTPWQLQFSIMLARNEDVDESELRSLFEQGGLALGLGTYRGVYGKFELAEWKK